MAGRPSTPTHGRPSSSSGSSGESPRLPYYSNSEVALHNVLSDCWVSYFGNVYNLTKLIGENKGQAREGGRTRRETTGTRARLEAERGCSCFALLLLLLD